MDTDTIMGMDILMDLGKLWITSTITMAQLFVEWAPVKYLLYPSLMESASLCSSM